MTSRSKSRASRESLALVKLRRMSAQVEVAERRASEALIERSAMEKERDAAIRRGDEIAERAASLVAQACATHTTLALTWSPQQTGEEYKSLGCGFCLRDRLKEAEARCKMLAREAADEVRSRELHADLNRRAAKALGKPFEGEGSSWHDIPECIVALKDRVEAAERSERLANRRANEQSHERRRKALR